MASPDLSAVSSTARPVPLSPDAAVAEVRDRVLQTDPRLGRTRLVCVDGPAGSGKTTLADRIRDAVTEVRPGWRVALLHMDDLYAGWTGAPAGARRLADGVLAPLAAGRTGAYRRYDWVADTYAEEHPVPTDLDVLIVEGVLSADAAVEPWPSVRVFVEAPTDVRLSRGIDRDGEAMRDHWLEWMRWEREYVAGSGTRDRADVLVDGTR